MMTENQNSFDLVLHASRKLARLSSGKVNQLLARLADAAEESAGEILAENQKDLDQMDQADPKYDRLKLTRARIGSIASDIRNVAALPGKDIRA